MSRPSRWWPRRQAHTMDGVLCSTNWLIYLCSAYDGSGFICSLWESSVTISPWELLKSVLMTFVCSSDHSATIDLLLIKHLILLWYCSTNNLFALSPYWIQHMVWIDLVKRHRSSKHRIFKATLILLLLLQHRQLWLGRAATFNANWTILLRLNN